jgi:hypothetical protein
MTEGEASKKIWDFEDVLKEIRKDLGHSNIGFKRGTLLGLFLNNITEILPNAPTTSGGSPDASRTKNSEGAVS